MPRVMVVYGTRPEAIKVAPVITSLESTPGVDVDVVVTGQHRAMLDQVNNLFGIEPRVDLSLMAHGQTLTSLASRALDGVGRVLAETPTDAVLVQGDTSTAAAAAIAGYYSGVPVFHLEAGLRSGRLDSPFPEEGNRRIIGHIAALHFAPTRGAAENLLGEGIDPSSIVVTGNTVIDALLHATDVPADFDADVQAAIDSGRRILLVTSHRRESWESGLASTARAIGTIVAARSDVHAVIPLHRNPIVREAFDVSLPEQERVTIVEPLDYHQFSSLLAASHLVITDSGGVQEEGPSLGKPVLVTRETTERPEGVEAGASVLVGTDEATIVSTALRLLDDDDAYAQMARAINPYGDGGAAMRVAAAIQEFFGSGSRIADFGGAPDASLSAAQAKSRGTVSHTTSVTGSNASDSLV
ncbi:UDP-N-acetylglucosamine 2-epimerase (non-hydrolyzing) [Microbacteriaceae bacterium SG_E_30_P1]|uniref:UDP-N-acetylglucosamine 2-epimerase (non-hydrolyzing) n=1 Tax=Antiquaquibacter oligotrophicus TaxID=2880260 RepID=A0ABT6KQM3_9MICO|nr:UDP-N-acetylglucosamine 2-epimerase (non-hydrolyzing) [Antiquaquibacter oligotrophicus]MDH6182286.1 UDP-N-acetylglucosamine 2-epimerase (non-hydrolyzing) [Antiquaquibacter oligotrophicus]UDF12057.1 UDP-N-acetylglucosamine 2-epimerase (non-hydrolyzing) [Antiquaquibacter oligotrophicus]